MNDPGIIVDASVAISSGMIVAAATAGVVASEYDSGEMLDAGGKAVIPGFVEPHTHAVFAGNRIDEFELRIKGASYLEVLEKGGGILSTMRATRAASLDELIELSRPRLFSLLAQGATTIEVKTGYGLDLESELRMLEVIEKLDQMLPVDLVPTFMPAHAVPPEFENDSDGYVDLICERMIPAAVSWFKGSHFSVKGTPFFIDVFCENGTFSVAQGRRIVDAGRKHGMNVKAHVDQFTNLGGVSMALEFEATSIDHLDCVTEAEVALIAKSDTVAVLCPSVNLHSGSTEFPNARRLLDTGAVVALSTDFNPGSSPCTSMPLVMALACRYLKMNPAESLNAATINASYACGTGTMAGSIEKGKQADLLILKSDDWRSAAYELGGNPIEKVIKNGRAVDAL